MRQLTPYANMSWFARYIKWKDQGAKEMKNITEKARIPFDQLL